MSDNNSQQPPDDVTREGLSLQQANDLKELYQKQAANKKWKVTVTGPTENPVGSGTYELKVVYDR